MLLVSEPQILLRFGVTHPPKKMSEDRRDYFRLLSLSYTGKEALGRTGDFNFGSANGIFAKANL